MMCLSMKKQLIKAAYIRQLFPRERHPMYFVGTFFRIMQDFRFVDSEPAGPGARDEILKKRSKESRIIEGKRRN